ncbi:MAG TPA: hypothetical protein VNT79_00995, partial [Phycisphaerae bacterium]|nr:hypothetical protein [Phycisphaerae bacterium]
NATTPGLIVTYTDIENYTDNGPFDTSTHVNNIGEDPVFRDVDGENDVAVDDDDDFRLTPCSSVLDRSDSNLFPTDGINLDNDNDFSELLPDQDTADRAFDHPTQPNLGVGTYTFVDLGAFELHVRGDLAPEMHDGLVDGRDIQPFVDCYLEFGEALGPYPIQCETADMDMDGELALLDVACFVDVLLGGEGCMEPCEEGGGPRAFVDCNENEVDDYLDIYLCDGSSPGLCDCNANGIPDECDIAEETSEDDDANGVPDACEPDCNQNGLPDAWDIENETSADCNTNTLPDECEWDCNDNGVPDDCDVDPTDPDGNTQVSEDCDENAVPDECDPDCDANGVPDTCDLDPTDPDGDSWVDPDCNGNYYPDACDIDWGRRSAASTPTRTACPTSARNRR